MNRDKTGCSCWIEASREYVPYRRASIAFTFRSAELLPPTILLTARVFCFLIAVFGGKNFLHHPCSRTYPRSSEKQKYYVPYHQRLIAEDCTAQLIGSTHACNRAVTVLARIVWLSNNVFNIDCTSASWVLTSLTASTHL